MANAWDHDPVVPAASAAAPAWANDPIVHGGRTGGDAGHVRPLGADEERMVPGGELLGAADTAYAGVGHAVAGVAKLVSDTPQALWDLYAHNPFGPNPGAPAHKNPFADWIDAHTPEPHTAIGRENFDTAGKLAQNVVPAADALSGGAVSPALDAYNSPGAKPFRDAVAPITRVVNDASVALPMAGRVVGAVGDAADAFKASRAAAGSGKYGLAGDANSPAAVAKAAGYNIPAPQDPNAGIGGHITHTIVGPTNAAHDAELGNQVVTNVHAHIDAGLPVDKRLNAENLAEAETPHNQTLNRAANIAQTAPASAEFTAALKKAGGTDILAEDDPRIQKIIDKINSHETLSGQDLLDVSRSTKARGRKYQKSPLPDQQELGDSLVRIAKFTDDELARRLPPGSPVQAEDVANARRSLAKIHTVQDAMVGDNVDATALARLDKRNPGLLDGRLGIIAKTAANHPQVMGLGQRVVDTGGHLSTHQGAALLAAAGGAAYSHPVIAGAAVGAAGAQAILRRVLAGSRSARIAAAEGAATNPALGQFFDRTIPPRAPNVLDLESPPGHAFEPNAPAPGPALDLSKVAPGEPFPAPTGSTNPTRATTLSPDGNSLPFERQFGAGEHGLGPDTGGLSLAPDVPRSPAADTGGISLADLLSHGVEQPAHPGLSLAPDYTPPNGLHVPGNTLADLLAGDLNTAEHVPGSRPNLSDVPAVMQEHPAPELALTDGVQPPRPPPTDAELAVPHGELPPTQVPPRKAAAASRPLGEMMDEERAHHPPIELASDETPRGLHASNVTELGTTASGAKIRKVGAGVELPGRDVNGKASVRPIEPGSTLISKGPDAKPTSYIAITPQEDGRLRLTSAHSDVKGEGQKQIAEAAHHADGLDKPLDSDVSVSRDQLFAWRAAIQKGTVTAATKFQKQIDKILASKNEKASLKMTTPIYTDIKPVIEN